MKNLWSMYRKTYWKDSIAVIVLSFLIVLSFWWVPQTYFQLDEWTFLGQYLLTRTDPSILFRVFQGMHFLPVEQAWLYIQYSLFWLQPMGYVVVSLVTHIIVAILGYVLLRLLSIRALPTFLGIAFFALNPVSSQVVSWSPASASGAVSVALFLSACIVWLYYRSKRSIYSDICVGILMFLSMLAKVDVIIGYFFIGVVAIFFTRKRTVSYTPIIVSFVLWLILYFFMRAFGLKEVVSAPSKSIAAMLSYISNIPEWMANIIVNHNGLRGFLKKFLGSYAQYFPLLDSDSLLKTISRIIAGLWYAWYVLLVWFKKEPVIKIVVFPIFVILSMLPYFFSLPVGMQSRHFYIPVFITGMWVAFFLDWMSKKKFFVIQNISLVAVALTLVGFVYANQPWENFLSVEMNRKALGVELQKITTPTTGTVVYYLENGVHTPYQSGIGQMLLVMQAHDDPAFVPYFKNYSYFLFGMYEQGYKKIGEKGFGYYYTIDDLRKDYQKGLFDASAVRAYYFDTDKVIFHDITKETINTLY